MPMPPGGPRDGFTAVSHPVLVISYPVYDQRAESFFHHGMSKGLYQDGTPGQSGERQRALRLQEHVIDAPVSSRQLLAHDLRVRIDLP